MECRWVGMYRYQVQVIIRFEKVIEFEFPDVVNCDDNPARKRRVGGLFVADSLAPL